MQGQKTIDIKAILEQLNIPMDKFNQSQTTSLSEPVLRTAEKQQVEAWNYTGTFFSLDMKKREVRVPHMN